MLAGEVVGHGFTLPIRIRESITRYHRSTRRAGNRLRLRARDVCMIGVLPLPATEVGGVVPPDAGARDQSFVPATSEAELAPTGKRGAFRHRELVSPRGGKPLRSLLAARHSSEGRSPSFCSSRSKRRECSSSSQSHRHAWRSVRPIRHLIGAYLSVSRRPYRVLFAAPRMPWRAAWYHQCRRQPSVRRGPRESLSPRWAGKPPAGSARRAGAWVYPRVGGETVPPGWTVETMGGPIPAWAGKPATPGAAR